MRYLKHGPPSVCIALFAIFWIFREASASMCRRGDICKLGSLCCESTDGTHWCCPKDQACCTGKKACCSVSSKVVKSLPKIYSYLHLNQFDTLTEAVESTNFSTRIHKDKSQPNSFQICDEEGLFLCSKRKACCQAGGLWYCCPHTNATCCNVTNNSYKTTSDSMEHEEYNNVKGTEISLEENSTKKNESSNGYILCPDDRRLCLDSNTCCLITNVTYGCCPYQDAVCCSDFVHCCPPDTVCNLGTLECDDPTGLSKLMFKL